MGMTRRSSVFVCALAACVLVGLALTAANAEHQSPEIKVFDGPESFCRAQREQSMAQRVQLVMATSSWRGLRSQVAWVHAQILVELARARSTSERDRAALLALARELELARDTNDYRRAMTAARRVDRSARRCR